jgi:hypothetical protein
VSVSKEADENRLVAKIQNMLSRQIEVNRNFNIAM